jgi:hypothetical protein
MKKIITSILIILFFTATPFVSNVFADVPPDPGGGPGSGDQPVGGGAPVGGGLIVMLVMGAAYGTKKTFFLNKEE